MATNARRRLLPRSELVQDGLLGAALGTIAVTYVLIANRHDPHERVTALAIALLVVEHAVLVARRRYPVAVLVVAGGAAAAYGMAPFVDPPIPFGALVAVYTVAACARRHVTAMVVLATVVGVGLATLLDPNQADFNDFSFPVLCVITAWLLGDRTARQDSERRRAAERATAEERARLARELHDVAAHQVSIIAVQAEAGQAMLPDQPERAASVLPAIAGAARDALVELRRVLGVLRAEDREATAPQPGLDQLDRLADQVRQAGLGVRVVVDGDHRTLPAGVDLSAYRIVQESLTNTLKHGAGATAADVIVRYRPGAVDLEVLDDGHDDHDGRDGNGNGTGHGLAGMRERVELLGGTITAGPRTDGSSGFAVRATLPV